MAGVIQMRNTLVCPVCVFVFCLRTHACVCQSVCVRLPWLSQMLHCFTKQIAANQIRALNSSTGTKGEEWKNCVTGGEGGGGCLVALRYPGQQEGVDGHTHTHTHVPAHTHPRSHVHLHASVVFLIYTQVSANTYPVPFVCLIFISQLLRMSS